MKCVQIADDLGSKSLSRRTWLPLRLAPHYPGYSLAKEPVLVSLLLASPKSVGPLGPWPGPPFIIQGDATVDEMHARQMSCGSEWWRGLVGLRAALSFMPAGKPC
jgi:hypothetical protein